MGARPNVLGALGRLAPSARSLICRRKSTRFREHVDYLSLSLSLSPSCVEQKLLDRPVTESNNPESKYPPERSAIVVVA